MPAPQVQKGQPRPYTPTIWPCRSGSRSLGCDWTRRAHATAAPGRDRHWRATGRRRRGRLRRRGTGDGTATELCDGTSRPGWRGTGGRLITAGTTGLWLPRPGSPPALPRSGGLTTAVRLPTCRHLPSLPPRADLRLHTHVVLCGALPPAPVLGQPLGWTASLWAPLIGATALLVSGPPAPSHPLRGLTAARPHGSSLMSPLRTPPARRRRRRRRRRMGARVAETRLGRQGRRRRGRNAVGRRHMGRVATRREEEGSAELSPNL